MAQKQEHSHYWKLRRDGFRELLLEHRWGMHGAYAGKYIGHREYITMTVEQHPDFLVCRFLPKESFWREVEQKSKRKA